jgi:hypothetical protein
LPTHRIYQLETKDNFMRKILIVMFLFSILVIPLHYSSAAYYSSLLTLLLKKPAPTTSNWVPLKPITLNQSHLNPYAPLGSQYHQIYTKSANDFSGWTNSSAPLGSQFNPIYVGNNSYNTSYVNLINPARLGTQFNPLYLSAPAGF